MPTSRRPRTQEEIAVLVHQATNDFISSQLWTYEEEFTQDIWHTGACAECLADLEQDLGDPLASRRSRP